MFRNMQLQDIQVIFHVSIKAAVQLNLKTWHEKALNVSKSASNSIEFSNLWRMYFVSVKQYFKRSHPLQDQILTWICIILFTGFLYQKVALHNANTKTCLTSSVNVLVIDGKWAEYKCHKRIRTLLFSCQLSSPCQTEHTSF